MSKKANPTVVGSFVIGAIALSIIGIMILGGASMFDETFDCILYFDESISGLDVGAPVDFQGVRIGTVTGVRLDFDREKGGEALRPVTMQIEGKRINLVHGPSLRGPAEGMEYLVTNKGMRARLATQSLLTGKLKVDLGFFPETPIARKHRDQGIWEMPTLPSPLKQVAAEVAQLPLSEIVSEVHRAVKGMADTLNEQRTGETVENLNQTLKSLDSVLGRLDTRIDPFADQSIEVMKAAQASLEELDQIFRKIDAGVDPLMGNVNETARRISNMLDPEAGERGQVAVLIEELRETSKSVRRLVEYLEQHPESILRGKSK